MSDDRDQILELFANFAWAMDAGDWGMLEDCLTPDVGYLGSARVPVDGREAFSKFLRDWRDELTAAQHLMSNFVVSQDGDQANVRAAMDVHEVRESSLWAAGVTLEAGVTRTNGGWRIAKLTTTSRYTHESPLPNS